MLSKTITELRYILERTTQEEFEGQGRIVSFEQSKKAANKMMIKGLTNQLMNETSMNKEANILAKKIERTNQISEKIELLDKLLENINEDDVSDISTTHIPSEVKMEIDADLNEITKCMNNGCYRSAVILCGRILETALHRKYYEVTGNDLLEKSPGIGLGNLIGKLASNGVKVDPGLMNQIHLVNQVRVYSVHTKQQAFKPSEQQAKAILLYTTDIIERLF